MGGIRPDLVSVSLQENPQHRLRTPPKEGYVLEWVLQHEGDMQILAHHHRIAAVWHIQKTLL